ncbi:MAG: S8 family serine peptidase [Thermodesulfobacteriota bacterium]
MKRTGYLFLMIIIFLMLTEVTEAAVTTSPSSITIPRGLQTTRSITYNFANIGIDCTQATSNNGQFISGQTILGDVNTPVSTQLNQGAGRATETVVIPIRVIKRAEELSLNRFQYRRVFNYSGAGCNTLPENSSVQITLTSEAAAEFKITRLQLYFENGRAEITVKRNQPHLKAYADIRFVGSGFLRGYWEVDGRILSYVNMNLVYGRSVTLESPEVPFLPTFETGTHIVKFVVTNPSDALPMPEAIYFVTAEEFRTIFSIRLISPKDRSELDYTPPTFQWEGKEKTVTYLIEFLEEEGGKPIFSAYTRKFDYSLPTSVLNNIFSSGKSYLWRVKGFDAENNIVGESPLFRFNFRELASYLPGQILMATELSQRGIDLIGRIGQQYNLGLLETYDIRSLHLKVAVFQTREDIFRLITSIVREDGVVLAQPNDIFRTMAEPLSDRQNLYRILNLKKLHERFRGKGVIVAVIDTGVDLQHRDLKERVLSSENLVKDSPYLPEIHGTAVAGVIGAMINGYGIEGMAPESSIISLRACRQVSETNPEGECYTSSISKAIDVAIEKKAKVVNMSFGSVSPDRLILKLIEEGIQRGLVFVAPAGNMPRQKELPFPASHPSVVAVAGIDDRGNPYPNQEIAKKALVSAPAMNVLTTIPADRHNFLTGTSMASACIAGLITVAAGKDGEIDKDKLPRFRGDICKWEEELLKVSICGE